MINGIFSTDRKTWSVDFKDSEFWNPEKYGITMFRPETIADIKDYSKYKFVFTNDCWENQNELELLKSKGLKIFFASREPVVVPSSVNAFFHYEDMRKRKGNYYFCPDTVFAAGQAYADLWKDKTKCEIVGYIRFEQYLSKFNRQKIRQKYGLDDRKVIFFPAFGPLLFEENNGGIYGDITPELNEVILGLEEISKDPNVQVVVKPHPWSQKYYAKIKKGTVSQKISNDIFKKHWDNRNLGLKIIDDFRFTGLIVKELMSIADVVIGSAVSTTILESLLLKKPTINILPGRTNSKNNKYDLENDVITVYNKSDLVKVIRSDVNYVDCSEVVEKYLGPVDGKFCERICTTIKESL